MKKFLIGCGAFVVVVVLGVLILVGVPIGRYNGLVRVQEKANGGKSMFAAAVNTCSQKMKSVWALADQEGLLEKETYVEVAYARSALESAQRAFDKAKEEKGSSLFDLTKLGAQFGQALVNVRVAFEAYPQLRTTETYQKAMAAVQEGFNEIKTALDDWIVLCRDYNTQRRYFFTNFLVNVFSWDFPEKLNYYEGGIKEPEQLKIPADDLNPRINR